MSSHATIASCSLNQWALDWKGNLVRIKASILEAKARGASLRVGSELEVCSTLFSSASRELYDKIKKRALIEIRYVGMAASTTS